MDIEEYSKYRQFYSEDVPDLLLEYLDSSKWQSYLDLGCGDGSLLNALKKLNYFEGKKVYAVDLSENRIKLVKKICGKILCIICDACDVKEVKDSSVDFLLSSQVIEHVKNDEEMIKEIFRMVRRGGKIYISTVFKKWYGWYFYRCCNRWTIDPTHIREYKGDGQLFSIFKKYGLTVLKSKKILIKRSLVDFLFKRMMVSRDVFIKYPRLRFLKFFKVPIPGYYIWEIVLEKK